MANAYTYGTGKAGQFTDGSQRQVLELGDKIHMYNPDMTPLLTIGGRVGSIVTPVPIFEWMEDEFFTQKSITQDIKAETAGEKAVGVNVGDTASGGINGHNTLVEFDRQANMEYFEVGAIYAASVSGGSAALQTAVTHFICVAVGQSCNTTNVSHKNVQFIGAHLKSGSEGSAVQVEQCADGSDLITVDAAGVLTLTYTGNLGYYDGGTYSGKDGLFQGEASFVDDKEFVYYPAYGGWNEGAAIGMDTSKKVRRLKNCTQIFREPYTITGTAMASEYYGGDELSRLQARKLAKFKTDIEWAMLTNGDLSLDASAENPKRTFAGFGINKSAGTGVISSLDGRGDTNLQLTESSATMANIDALCEYIFQDMIGGTTSKTVFCSNRWLRFLADRVRSASDSGISLNAGMGSNVTAGLRVTNFHGSIGDLNFVVHPMLNGALDNLALVVDFSNFSMRPLSGRNTQLRTDVVQDGRDGRTDEWLLECGPEIRNEQTHAILKLV